ncbi:MAG: endonuclease/exonuclease/phosphatase family protein [Lachnospiraceae bacterium]|nr:endonuclease/exonuclease/phosphatase family protein [Lachnospiraceae bacterium]
MKKVLKVLGIVLLVFVLVFGAYFAYLFIAYHRVGDASVSVAGETKETGKGNELEIVSWNVGFGAYESDYGFFMDGGTESWAWSKERLNQNLDNITALLKNQNADIYLLQEVDFDSTRTYKVDERLNFISALGEGRQYTFAQNNDSPFLMYPFTQPHGFMRTGIMTFSAYPIREASRVELPVESGFSKIFDLDRCYSKHYIDMQDGGTLVLYNLHCSAYTSDGTIAVDQIRQLLADMQKEYDAGAWCIAGGDFNKDLLGDSSKYFGISGAEYNWAKPIPEEVLEGHNASFAVPLYPVDGTDPVPTVRNADAPYNDKQFVLTIDGFLVTDNVSVEEIKVIDTKFAYSDHNPIRMRVTLLNAAETKE